MQKKSFFEKLTGVVKVDESDEKNQSNTPEAAHEDENADAELAVDMYQTPSEIVIQAMIAGVKPEDMDISITRDMVTIKGSREDSEDTHGDDFFHKELYWGAFSRTLVLPEEIDVEEASATNKNGLLILTLPKIDKYKQAKIKVKTV